jgi:hypothetical protein
MVLMMSWMDDEWRMCHCTHFLSRSHGPEGFSHGRGGTSEESFSPVVLG